MAGAQPGVAEGRTSVHLPEPLRPVSPRAPLRLTHSLVGSQRSGLARGSPLRTSVQASQPGQRKQSTCRRPGHCLPPPGPGPQPQEEGVLLLPC